MKPLEKFLKFYCGLKHQNMTTRRGRLLLPCGHVNVPFYFPKIPFYFQNCLFFQSCPFIFHKRPFFPGIALLFSRNFFLFSRNVLLDPQPRLEGSYKIGSVCRSFRSSFLLSFCLSVSFLGIGSLVFSETYHGVRDSYIVVCDRAGFFGKKPSSVKNDEKWSKWPKNMVFALFKKITS